jgi:hypothetical protein
MGVDRNKNRVLFWNLTSKAYIRVGFYHYLSRKKHKSLYALKPYTPCQPGQSWT